LRDITSDTTISSPNAPGASGWCPMTSGSWPARIRIGMLVTRVPIGKSPEQSGPWPTTSPMNSWPMIVSRSESHTNRGAEFGWSM
jgi:hypothetical protein